MWLIERKLHVTFFLPIHTYTSSFRFRGPPEDYWHLSSFLAATYALG